MYFFFLLFLKTFKTTKINKQVKKDIYIFPFIFVDKLIYAKSKYYSAKYSHFKKTDF